MDITKIIDHLATEAAIYKEFISVLQQETECLVSRDYKRLYETVGAKETLLARIRKMTDARAALLSGAGCGPLTDKSGREAMAAVLDSAPEAQKEELRRRRDIISSLIDTIQEVNRVNSLVIKNSLEHINKTLGFFGNFMPASVYKPSGAFGGLSLKGSRLSEGA